MLFGNGNCMWIIIIVLLLACCNGDECGFGCDGAMPFRNGRVNGCGCC